MCSPVDQKLAVFCAFGRDLGSEQRLFSSNIILLNVLQRIEMRLLRVQSFSKEINISLRKEMLRK